MRVYLKKEGETVAEFFFQLPITDKKELQDNGFTCVLELTKTADPKHLHDQFRATISREGRRIYSLNVFSYMTEVGIDL